jgi:hypothetical protein
MRRSSPVGRALCPFFVGFFAAASACTNADLVVSDPNDPANDASGSDTSAGDVAGDSARSEGGSEGGVDASSDSGGAADTRPPADTIGVDTNTVDTRPPPDTTTDTTGCTPHTDLEFTPSSADVAYVSRARAIAVRWRSIIGGSVQAVTFVVARQRYDCPEDPMVCKSPDPACTVCLADSEGTCTCSATTGSEGQFTAKLHRGTPGSSTVIATAFTTTSGLGTSSTVRFAFTGAPSLPAGTDYFVGLETDASALQIALRGGAGAPASLQMSLRQPYVSTAWSPYASTGPRPAIKVEVVSCP